MRQNSKPNWRQELLKASGFALQAVGQLVASQQVSGGQGMPQHKRHSHRNHNRRGPNQQSPTQMDQTQSRAEQSTSSPAQTTGSTTGLSKSVEKLVKKFISALTSGDQETINKIVIESVRESNRDFMFVRRLFAQIATSLSDLNIDQQLAWGENGSITVWLKIVGTHNGGENPTGNDIPGKIAIRVECKNGRITGFTSSDYHRLARLMPKRRTATTQELSSGQIADAVAERIRDQISQPVG